MGIGQPYRAVIKVKGHRYKCGTFRLVTATNHVRENK